ncbi:trypsin-1-like [Anabrus simplex]|uniref:trypsin-1-like n=1 Tax=Anabrus simplex TaxID=316456 RepID=UPI0035A37393
MLRLQILISLLGFCFASDPDGGRIVGGEPADIRNFPYQVAYLNRGSMMCGASIIGNEWVVTAAHCVVGMSAGQITIRAGSSRNSDGGSVHKVTQLIPHERYTKRGTDNDIALAKVSPPFRFGGSVKAIPLNDRAVTEGTAAVVSGWGVTAEGRPDPSPILRQVKVPVVNHAKCDREYGGGITQNMICAGFDEGKKDACQGDSGGPLAASGKLIGVVSFGNGCGAPNSPGVYTDVSKFRAWIKQKSGI